MPNGNIKVSAFTNDNKNHEITILTKDKDFEIKDGIIDTNWNL